MVENVSEIGELRWRIKGVACAVCAQKIENLLNKRPEITHAAVNFGTGVLSVVPSRTIDEPTLRRMCTAIARQIDEGAELSSLHTQPADEELTRTQKMVTLKHLVLGAAVICFASHYLFNLPRSLKLILDGCAWLLAGWDVALEALLGLKHLDFFNENTLMTAATIGAWILGDSAEAAAVMIFYQIGEQLQDYAVDRSRRSIASLMDIRPQWADKITGSGTKRVPPEALKTGDTIVIAAGERVPVDATVLKGTSSLDTAALTGESTPCDVEPGAVILSGSVNISGTLEARVDKPYDQSTVARILDLVQEASSRKAPTEQMVTRIARIYTPFVFAGAIFVALLPPLIFSGSWHTWIYRALVFLVTSCPCALVLSVPLTFFAGIGAASRRGVLIKGGNYLEALSRMDVVVYDKTGTLTKGRFSVSRLTPAPGITPQDLLKTAAFAEAASTHPIARSIVEAWVQAGHQTPQRPTSAQEIAGRGLKVEIDGQTVLAGNKVLLQDVGIAAPESGSQTAVWIARSGDFLGTIAVADQLKPDSAATVARLRAQGVSWQAMLTGDRPETAQTVASTLKLDEIRAGLLPDGKVKALEDLKSRRHSGGTLIFVGDGINDAPVLAAADVGVAMGGLGSDAAIEAADAVLMTDEPGKLAMAHALAKNVVAIAHQNIVFALGVKTIVMILGAAGYTGLWAAVFADAGVALLAVLNALRAMNFKG